MPDAVFLAVGEEQMLDIFTWLFYLIFKIILENKIKGELCMEQQPGSRSR